GARHGCSRAEFYFSARRRNNKPASCEPCRRDKVRCDHALPICTRCKNRAATARCFYHPAPLTRGRGREQPNFHLTDGVPFDRSKSARNSHLCEDTHGNSHIPVVFPDTALFSDTSCGKPLLSGYFGPTSFVSLMTDDVDLVSRGASLDPEAAQRVLPVYWAQKVSEVLLGLEDFTIFEALIHEYYKLSQTAVIPAPYILNGFPSMKTLCKDFSSANTGSDLISSVTVRIIQNTAETFRIPPSTPGKGFHTIFTGSAIRLEVIGVLCCLAGRAAYMGLANVKLDGQVSRSQFARTMLAAGDVALHVCKILTPLNDLIIWLVYENLLLSNLVNGDSSPQSWNRLGELSTDIFALGLHRSSSDPEGVMEYLLESRRRLFAAAYQLDKSIATFLGRPPRIPLRYSDYQLPLDISDTALASDNEGLHFFKADLDENGWHLQRRFQRASWIRMRYILSTFRDEILELSMQKLTPGTIDSLNDLSKRCHQAWASLPSHLRYTQKCQEKDYPVGTWLMLIISYLAYLYNDLLIQRLLVGKNNPRGNGPLLSASANILKTVQTLGTRRERMVDLRPDFTWTILLYGLTSASLLIKALQHEKRTKESILYDGSRSALIRNICVFIYHLENTLLPDNANYALFQRASQAFSNMMDEILEPQTPITDLEISHDQSEFDQLIDMNVLDMFNTTDSWVAFDQWLL
ncbi:hypothetical protein N7492_008142, partial [Penicillium capsulatum]